MPNNAAFGLLAATLLVSACAKAPEAINAVPMPVSAYADLSCSALQSEFVDISIALENASARQRAAQSGDAAGVLFIGLPLASMAGNGAEVDVAFLKGKRNALVQRASAAGCVLPQVPI